MKDHKKKIKSEIQSCLIPERCASRFVPLPWAASLVSLEQNQTIYPPNKCLRQGLQGDVLGSLSSCPRKLLRRVGEIQLARAKPSEADSLYHPTPGPDDSDDILVCFVPISLSLTFGMLLWSSLKTRTLSFSNTDLASNTAVSCRKGLQEDQRGQRAENRLLVADIQKLEERMTIQEKWLPLLILLPGKQKQKLMGSRVPLARMGDLMLRLKTNAGSHSIIIQKKAEQTGIGLSKYAILSAARTSASQNNLQEIVRGFKSCSQNTTDAFPFLSENRSDLRNKNHSTICMELWSQENQNGK